MVAMPIADIELMQKGAYDDPGAKQSFQARSKPSPFADAPINGFVADQFTIMLGQAADEVPPWTYYPQVRDRYLRSFFRASDGLLAAAVNNMQSKLRSLPYKVKAPGPRTQKKYSDLLGYANFGQGFASLLGQIAVDMYTQDNGWFVELIGAGAPDRPLRGPILQLAAMDSNRCWRSFDPEFPVLYMNPYDGQYHKIHKTRVMYGSSFTQSDEMARGIGFCAESRALRYAQVARDVAIYQHEKLGGQFRRAIGYGNGFTPSQVDQALQQNDAANDAKGLTRFSLIPFILSGMDNAKLNVLDLATLPDGFDLLTHMNLWAYILAFCFGTDAREFWPAATSGATRADATIQNMKAQGKGFAEDVRSIEHMINWFVFPEGVELEFDNKDDQQDQMVATLHTTHTTNTHNMIADGEITPQEGRAILISKGVIDPAVLDTATAPILADDTAPVDLAAEPDAAAPLQLPATTTPPQAGYTGTPIPPATKQVHVHVKAVPDLRGGRGKYERRTDKYSKDLQKLLTGLQAELDDAENEADIDAAIDTFAAQYRKKAATGLTTAFGIGLAGKQPSPDGIERLAAIAAEDSNYFESSFLPDLRAEAKGALAAGLLGTALVAFAPRLGMYAGSFWQSIWAGTGDHVGQLQADAEGEAAPMRVRRVLDPNAENCNDCPALAIEYDSFEDMEAIAGVPGDGSTECLGNCRCHLEFETSPGVWERLSGPPTVFTRPLISFEAA